MTRRHALLFSLLAASTLTLAGALQAQDAGMLSSGQAQLSAYTCTFNTDTGRAEIRASLVDADGSPLPLDEVTLAVSRVGASAPLTPDAVSAAPSDPRQPARIIVVLDTTDTMPVETVRDSLFNNFLTVIPFEDEVALVTFAGDVSQPTEFYVDKNALFNDHLFDLSGTQGDNRLNDAILAGVSATQPNSPARQVVLVITDSTPRVDQATAEEIITRAQASHAQIIPIALHTTQDRPDDEALFALANATRGYGYGYDGDKRDQFLRAGLDAIFADIIGTLNTEIVISVDLTDQAPDESGFIPFDVSATPNSSQTALTDRVSCPPPPVATNVENPLPTFAIAFANIVDGFTLESPLTVEAAVQPFDQLPADARFFFLLDDELSPESVEATFPLDPNALAPGRHTLRAQMRSAAGDILASTATVNLFTRRDLELSTTSGDTDNLTGTVGFQAGNTSDNMTEVQFRAALANDAEVTYPIGSAPVENGAAVLTIENIQAEAQRLFPQDDASQGWTLQITALAPSPTEGDPPLGASVSPLIISIAPAPPLTVETLIYGPIVPIVVGVIFLLIDFVLWRQVRKARIRRMIEGTDKHDLPAQLMCVTISRGGAGRQTFMLTKKSTYVGRGSGNDIQLDDDANISRQHGAILWRKQKWYFANRKAKVKTRIGGRSIKGLAMVKLDNPTDIELGSYQVVFHSTEQRQDISDLVKTNL